jgi:DNA-binding PadR family transcriptional regulator
MSLEVDILKDQGTPPRVPLGHATQEKNWLHEKTICRSSVYSLSSVTSDLREPSFFVLTALAAEPRYGYGVMQEVERLSQGRIRLRAGTLYAALDRLSGEGLIEVEREEVVDGRLRRYYRLTEAGGKVLAAESRRRMAVSKEALRRLRLAGGFA